MSIFDRIWACYGAHFLVPIGIYLPSPSFVYGLVCPSGGVPFIAVPLVGSAFCFRSKQDRQPPRQYRQQPYFHCLYILLIRFNVRFVSFPDIKIRE